jgi:hypothetical protein
MDEAYREDNTRDDVIFIALFGDNNVAISFNGTFLPASNSIPGPTILRQSEIVVQTRSTGFTGSRVPGPSHH